jgi:hypothetical protein
MTKVNFYPNDDPDTAAKKLAKENDVWFTIPKGKDNDKKHEHFVQKCTVSDFIAEAVIVWGYSIFCSRQIKIWRRYLRKINSARRYKRM